MLALLLLAVACGPEPSRQPVGELRVAEEEVALPYPWAVTLEARFLPTAPLDGGGEDLLAFVHLLDAEGEIVRTFDHPFPGPWRSGETVVDRIALWQSALAPPLEAGRYTLTLGLVEQRSGSRLPLATDAAVVDEGEYAVATVTVPEVGAEASTRTLPEVEFSGAWRRTRPGTDKQILAMRSLETEGSLTLHGLEGPVRLVLGLLVPHPEEGGFRVVQEAEGAALEIVLRSPCADEPLRLTGPGEHRVELPLRPPKAGGPCRVQIDPTFVLVHPETFTRRTATLVQMSWVPMEEEADRRAPGDDD